MLPIHDDRDIYFNYHSMKVFCYRYFLLRNLMIWPKFLFFLQLESRRKKQRNIFLPKAPFCKRHRWGELNNEWKIEWASSFFPNRIWWLCIFLNLRTKNGATKIYLNPLSISEIIWRKKETKTRLFMIYIIQQLIYRRGRKYDINARSDITDKD